MKKTIAVAVLTAVLGVLMIANVPFYSFKAIDMHGRVPFAMLYAAAAAAGLFSSIVRRRDTMLGRRLQRPTPSLLQQRPWYYSRSGPIQYYRPYRPLYTTR